MIKKSLFTFLSVLIIALFFIGAVSAAEDYTMWKGDIFRSGYTDEAGPQTNEILWSTSYVPSGDPGMYPAVDASPVVADGYVYYAVWGDQSGSANGIYCADAYTGELKWKYPAATRGGFSLNNGVLYSGTIGGTLVALNALTGEKIWSTGQLARYAFVGLSGAPLVFDGRVYIVGTNCSGSEPSYSYSSSLYVIDTDTGNILPNRCASLQSSDGDGGIGKFASLCSDGRMIYAAGCGGIAKYDPVGSKKVIQTFDVGARASQKVWASTPVYSGGKLYQVKTPESGVSTLYCVNAETLSIEWEISDGNIGSSTPAVTNDKIIVTGKNGLTIFDKSGVVLGHYQTGTTGLTSPVVAGNTAYFGTTAEGTLYAVNLSDCSLVWRYTMPLISQDNPSYYSMIEGTPAVYDGNLYIGSANCVMYAFGIRPEFVEIKNTVTDGTWSAVTKAEVVYEFDSSVAGKISAPQITHGGKTIKIGMDNYDSVVVQKKVNGVWSDVSASVDSGGSLVISGDISGADRLKAVFTGRCLGDVDGEYGVDVFDSTNILYYIVKRISFTDTQLFYADVDGEYGVDVFDSTNILYYIVKRSDEHYKIK